MGVKRRLTLVWKRRAIGWESFATDLNNRKNGKKIGKKILPKNRKYWSKKYEFGIIIPDK